jgi:hypothetical protein
MSDFRRVRMKVAGYIDRSTEAWDRGVVGIWYGAWTAPEWKRASAANPTDPWSELRDLPHQQQLGWTNYKPDMRVVRRFEALGPEDWVVVFLRDRGEIGLAQLASGLHSEEDHPLNHRYDDGSFETFKFRRLKDRKVFPLSQLPDAYRLLPAQGRGNLERFHGMNRHVRLLGTEPDARAVRAVVDAMDFDQVIEFLGASAWESVCTAYLTMEHGFVPTGLSTGSTLATFDIVGRSLVDSAYILAQCKKDPGPVRISDEFVDSIQSQTGVLKAFYFAYGGCVGVVPKSVEVIGRKEILAWVQTERGGMYRRLLAGL